MAKETEFSGCEEEEEGVEAAALAVAVAAWKLAQDLDAGAEHRAGSGGGDVDLRGVTSLVGTVGEVGGAAFGAGPEEEEEEEG